MSEYDRYIENAKNHGMQPIISLVYGNPLYGGGYAPSDRESIDAFVSYAAAIAKRYPQLKYYEVWNEPNSSAFWTPYINCGDYVNLVQAVSAALKQINPDIEIIGGALAGAHSGFAQRLLACDFYDYIDAFSTHPYLYYGQDADSSLKSRIGTVNAVILESGGFKEHYITEVGFSTYSGSATENKRIQAKELVKQAVISDANDVEVNLVYQFADTSNNTADSESMFGVMNLNRTPKKAYISGSALLDAVGGAVFAGKLSVGSGVQAYLYRKNGNNVLAAWSPDSAYTLQLDGETVSYTDMFGNVCAQNVSTVPLGDEPVYIHGLSDNRLYMAIADGIREKADEYLAYAGLESYSYLFDASVQNAENRCADGLAKHFETADNIISLLKSGVITEKQASALLSAVQLTSKLWISVYAETQAVNAADKISALKTKAKSSGDTHRYTDAMIKTAEKYAHKAAETKNDNVCAYNEMAVQICSFAEKFLACETDGQSGILIQVPSGQQTLEYGAAGDLEVNVYNYTKNDISGALLELVSAKNEVLGSTVISVKSGAGTAVDISAAVMRQLTRLGYEGEAENPYRVNSVSDYEFTVSGKRCIMLDTAQNDASKYLVAAKEVCGPKKYSSAGQQIFNPSDSGSAAYYLNNGYLNALPESLADCIDKNHYYTTEGASPVGARPVDYQVKCAVALPSHNELVKYSGILGLSDGSNASLPSWKLLLRTADFQEDRSDLCKTVNIRNSGGNTFISTSAQSLGGTYYLRPIFWTSKDMFVKNHIDLSAAGAAVKRQIRSDYTRQQLKNAGYSESELFDVL